MSETINAIIWVAIYIRVSTEDQARENRIVQYMPNTNALKMENGIGNHQSSVTTMRIKRTSTGMKNLNQKSSE